MRVADFGPVIRARAQRVVRSIPGRAIMMLQSHARYAMVIFPVYLVLAQLGRNEFADQIIRVVFLTVFSLMTAMFAAHISFGLS
jgi:Zn-dependent protease